MLPRPNPIPQGHASVVTPDVTLSCKRVSSSSGGPSLGREARATTSGRRGLGGRPDCQQRGVPSHFCRGERGDNSASRPTPGLSADARRRSRLHRTRVIAERHSRLPGPARGSVQPRAASRLDLVFRTTTVEGASTPFSREENRGEETLSQMVSGSGRPGIPTLRA